MPHNTQYTKVLVPFSFDRQKAFEQMQENVIEVQRDGVSGVADIRTAVVYYLRNTTKSRAEKNLVDNTKVSGNCNDVISYYKKQ